VDRILNERTTAEALSLSVKTLQKWRRDRLRGPAFVKMGRAVGYRESDIDAWLRKIRIATTEQK
jgi:predicted DNA-binding transcriptional regulator AlpA